MRKNFEGRDWRADGYQLSVRESIQLSEKSELSISLLPNCLR